MHNELVQKRDAVLNHSDIFTRERGIGEKVRQKSLLMWQAREKCKALSI
jgi:hypothetical protein